MQAYHTSPTTTKFWETNFPVPVYTDTLCAVSAQPANSKSFLHIWREEWIKNSIGDNILT